MRKSLLSLLVLFVYSLVAFAQEGTEITWSGPSDWTGIQADGKQTQISIAQGDWSITASKEQGSTSPTVNATYSDFRSYAKNVVLVMNNAENIGKLVFHMSDQGKKQWGELTASEGTVTVDTVNGLTIWEGEAQYVMLTVGADNTYGTNKKKTAGQFDFSSVTAYTAAELAVTGPDPDPDPEPVPGFVLCHAGYNGNPGYIGFNGTEVGAEGVLVTLPNLAAADKSLLTWQLVETETEGEYKIKNVGSGLYLGACGAYQSPNAVAEENAPVYTKADYSGFTTFNCPSGTNAPTYSWLHLNAQNKLTGWMQSSTASWFTVQNPSAIDSVLNILAKAEELESAIAAAQTMKNNITGYTEYTDLITSADQFNSNAKESSEGSYEALLDGNPTTFFHSQWNTGWADKMPHDLQVKLPGNELTELVVKYGARYNAGSNNGGYCNIPTAMNVFGGTVDAEGNVTWAEQPFVSLTAEADAKTRFDVEGIGGRTGRFTLNTGETVYTAFKFQVTDAYDVDTRNDKYFAYGEFQISAAREVAPSVEASENQVFALDYAVAQAQAAQLGVSDYDALIAGINTAMANIENGVEPEPIPEVQEALNAALADAQEAIALRGPGYPVADGESYNTLSAAITTAQALTYPLPANVDSITAAVRAYKCARDVEMPAVNHRYAFAITYKGETKYYLQYADSVNVLKKYVEGEELTDSLIFKCVEENDGKFTFTNSAGTYLTITQPAKSWLNPNNTGVSEEKNENTDVTFAKIYNGNAVAAEDETELFGCLSWYGVRGYDTGNNANAYGYLVVKHSADAFDGAGSPYYDANFTSAIKLIDLGVEPTRLVSVTPAMTEELTALPEQVVFTFEKDVQEVTSVRLRHNGWGGMRGTELVGEEGVVVTDSTTVTVNVPASLVQGVNQMSLTLMGTAVDGGALSDGENGEMVVVQYQYTPNPARFVFTEANPANGSIVEKLDTIVVSFQHPAEGLTGGFAKDVVLNVLNADSIVVTTAKIDFDMATDDGWNTNALITLAEPVTAIGTYTITVPEATVFDDKFNDMFEDYGVADWGAIYNPEFTLTYKIPAPPTLLVSVTPAMTEELTALPEQVVFTFEKDVQEVTSVRLRHNGWGGMRGTELVGEEGVVVTDSTTVTVNVPASLVQGVNQMSLTLMGTAVDGGALSDGENGEMVVVQYQYTPNPARFVFTEANPANGSIVEKLDTIVVSFQHPAEGLTGGFAKDVVLNVLNADSIVVTTAKIDFDMATDDGWNTNALITLAEPVTAIGTYTITVPEATVFDDKFNDMFEDYGVADWGAIYNPEFTLTYTVGDPTGINAVTLDKNAKVYTLDGRRVIVNGKLNRGFYIINGQKTFVK